MKNSLFPLLFASLFLVGCGEASDPSLSSDPQVMSPPPVEAPVVSPSDELKDFTFVLGAGTGEWHLEELLFSTPIWVSNYDVRATVYDAPYLRQSSVEMVSNFVSVLGRYDQKTRELDAKYNIENTEKSGVLTYVQRGSGTIKGVVSADKKTITIDILGEKTSITKEGDREMTSTTLPSKYTVTVPVLLK